MESVIKRCLLLSMLTIGSYGCTQQESPNHLVKNSNMETTISTNKQQIHQLYETIMNGRNFDLLGSVVSEGYTNSQGEMGLETFKQGVVAVITAFPDAKWTITEIIAEGNKVFVKQRVQGTHTGMFQRIPPTNNTISNEGMVIYEFEEGKIIRHEIQTDRLGFLRQLGVLPADPVVHTQDKKGHVFFVDKFSIPKQAMEEFTQRMNANRNLIKSIPGFMKDEVMVYADTNGDSILMTIAVWENRDSLDKAKQLVAAEYEKMNFNPSAFLERLNITLERGVYTTYPK